MTLNLKPEVEAGLHSLAQARGVSVEDYLQLPLANELPQLATNSPASQEGIAPASGLVRENGLLVHRTGHPLPAGVIDEVIQQSREQRIPHILGDHR